MSELLRPKPTIRSQVPSLVAHGSCFPYGGVKRIRFEDFRGRSCPNLSPELRARLNEVSHTKDAEPAVFQLKSSDCLIWNSGTLERTTLISVGYSNPISVSSVPEFQINFSIQTEVHASSSISNSKSSRQISQCTGTTGIAVRPCASSQL